MLSTAHLKPKIEEVIIAVSAEIANEEAGRESIDGRRELLFLKSELSLT